MGRITIFSISSCPHCDRVKSLLKSQDVPYSEINLTDYPHRRADMLALTDAMTVPQVFFNSKHIGGADDTVKLVSSENWTHEEFDKILDPTVPVSTTLCLHEFIFVSCKRSYISPS